jgi:hypothetical protein
MADDNASDDVNLNPDGQSNPVPPDEAMAYCLHDRNFVRIITPVVSTIGTGRQCVTGTCEMCGGSISKICLRNPGA